MPLPDYQQRVMTMIGFIYSDEQAHCRWSSAIRQQCGCYWRCTVIQVSENLLNNCWIFDPGGQTSSIWWG